MTETPLYRPITAGEFLHERKMRFSPDSLEATGIPFDAISHGGTEPLTPPMPSPDWQSRLGSISQVMPLDFEGYAAILLPWVAFRGQIRYDVEGIAEAYRSFGLPFQKSDRSIGSTQTSGLSNVVEKFLLSRGWC